MVNELKQRVKRREVWPFDEGKTWKGQSISVKQNCHANIKSTKSLKEVTEL